MAMASRIENTPACIEMRAPQTTREKHVAAEVVGAERMRPRRRLADRAPVGAHRIAGRDPRGAHRHDHEEQHDRGANQRGGRRPAHAPAPAQAAGRAAPAPRRRGAVSRRGWRAVDIATGTSDPDARVQHGVGDVDQQVDQHVGRRGDQHHALHERVVAREDGLHDQPAEAGQHEDLLGDDGAAIRAPIWSPGSSPPGSARCAGRGGRRPALCARPLARAVRT